MTLSTCTGDEYSRNYESRKAWHTFESLRSGQTAGASKRRSTNRRIGGYTNDRTSLSVAATQHKQCARAENSGTLGLQTVVDIMVLIFVPTLQRGNSLCLVKASILERVISSSIAALRSVFFIHFYMPGMPTTSRIAGITLGKKYTTKMPLNATNSPVNFSNHVWKYAAVIKSM